MNTRLAFLFGFVFMFSVTFMLAEAAQTRQGGRQPEARPSQTRTNQNRPRANQGHVPKAPPARTNPAEQRQAEHLPTGHVNEMPHVNHDQWFGHEQPNDARFHQAQPFAHGRLKHVGPAYRHRVTRVDLTLHRFWFSKGLFEVAAWDWPLCADWCWNCGDDFVVYDDSDHPGWYMLYNVHTGVYVHVQYMGS